MVYALGSILTSAVAAAQLDGESAFMEFIRSAGRAFTHNQAAAPLFGLVVLGVLIVLADWKFAGWIQGVWRKRHSRREGAQQHAQTHEHPARR